jgi:glucan phosphoethanolaminetransferase (alkaline phosphatase superfamily)
MQQDQKQLAATFACFFLFLLLLAFLFVRHAVSPRQFALALLGLMCAGSVLFFFIFKSARQFVNQDRSADRVAAEVPAATLRRLKIFAVALPIILILGLWITRGQPLLPRAVGAAINLFFTFAIISVLRRAKRRSG